MVVVASGSASAQDLSTYKALVSLVAPLSGVAEFVVELRLLAMNAGNSLIFKQDQGSGLVYLTTAAGTGNTAAIVTLRRFLAAGQPTVAVSVKDNAGLSTAADYSYTVYRVDELEMDQPSYLLPKESHVPLLFRVGPTSPGFTPTVTLLKNGAGGFVACTGVVSIIGDGWCMLTPSAEDTSTEGPLILKAVSGATTGIRTVMAAYQVFSDTAAEEIADAIHTALEPDFAAIMAAIDAADLPGGSQAVEILVTGEDASPLDNALCWVTNDEAGTQVVDGRKYSNDNGEVTFMLDPGNYFLWADRGGKNSVQAQPLTVE